MKPEIKKLLILNLPYLLFVCLFDKVGAAVRLSPGADASAKLLHLGDGFTTCLLYTSNPGFVFLVHGKRAGLALLGAGKTLFFVSVCGMLCPGAEDGNHSHNGKPPFRVSLDVYKRQILQGMQKRNPKRGSKEEKSF